jgi:opacity protein-like surface antigen
LDTLITEALVCVTIEVESVFPSHYPECFLSHLRRARILRLLVLALTVFVTHSGQLGAQAVPSATARRLTIWAGGEYSNFQTDFESQRMGGLGAYADFDRTPHWGAEAEARWFRFGGGSGQTAANYLLGGRYRFPRAHSKVVPYAKFLAGSGVMKYPGGIGHGSYFAYTPGAGVGFHASLRISFRVEYEYQRWPAAPGFPGVPSHGLSPNGFSVGVAWRLP